MIAERTQAIHHIPIAPDVTYLVNPEHYEAALDVDARRWVPAADAATCPAWAGRSVWRLQKGQVARSLWQLYAYAGERVTQERERAELADLQHPIVERYLHAIAQEQLAAQPLSITHRDTLYARMTRHVQRYALSEAEVRFWVQSWMLIRDAAYQVWRDHETSLHQEATRDRWYPRHCGPDDGEPSPDDMIEKLAADAAARAAVSYGGA